MAASARQTSTCVQIATTGDAPQGVGDVSRVAKAKDREAGVKRRSRKEMRQDPLQRTAHVQLGHHVDGSFFGASPTHMLKTETNGTTAGC